MWVLVSVELPPINDVVQARREDGYSARCFYNGTVWINNWTGDEFPAYEWEKM